MAQSSNHPQPKSRRVSVAVIVAVLLIVLAVVGVFVAPDGSKGGSDAADPAPSGAGQSSGARAGRHDKGDISAMKRSDAHGLARRDAKDPYALGDVNAPLVMIEYADFRCPFCTVFAGDVLPQIKKEYIDTGYLRLEWRDLPLFGKESIDAAVGGKAAGRQGKFWEYYRDVFANSDGNGHQSLPRNTITDLAKKAGVTDVKAFQAGFDDKQLAELVAKDASEANQIGFTSTPSFIVGQTAVVGAQPIDQFREAIDSELDKLR